MIMEPYITLSYTVKYENIDSLWYAMREVFIILQVPLVNKLKYTRAMVRQIHIFNTKAADPQMQEIYLANTLINLRKLPHIFYEINLFPKYQNSKFKRFCTNGK